MKARALLGIAAPYRRPLVLVAFLTITGSLVMLAIPALAGHMIGGIISRTPSIGRLVLLLMLSLVALTLLNVAVATVSATTAARLLADLRVKIYEHLQRLPLEFHQTHRQGDTLALATFEVSRLSQFLTGTLVNLPARLLTVVGAVVLMFRIDRHLALLVPLLIPAFFIILKLVGRRLRGLAASLQQAEANIIAVAEENLAMLPAIKSFAREEAEAGRYRLRVTTAKDLWIQDGRIYATLEPVIGFVASVGAVLLLYAAGINVQSGNMTSTQLFSFLFYAAILTRPVGALANIYGQVQTARGTLARLQSVLDRPFEPGYAAIGKIERPRGAVDFSGVYFGYPGRGPTLSDVNFRIEAGEIVAFTGENGAGKTTLVNLLLRFRDPDCGTIRLDGENIVGINVQNLRRQIGFVPQRSLLFNDTIKANIAYGSDSASDEAVERAARLSQAYEFVVDLPLGFDTQIGDQGVLLSGGQRQRISLARALIKDPAVLILDEATSMYDAAGEQAFLAECVESLKGRTILFITHRPTSLAIADRIIAFGNTSVREVTAKPKRIKAAP